MLLCCLNRSSHTFGALTEAQAFCVNVLAVEDAGVAHHFAGDRLAAEKFAVGDWETAATGAPALTTALAAFDCELDRMVEAGSHAIMIGSVKAVILSEGERRALLYAQGGYGRFTAQDAQAALAAS